ncbi:MAG: aminotransferase class V-fold PLP-dependent enzyme [Reinekea sp.]
MSFDVKAVRADFPILAQEVNGKPLVYLDNGATTQKPDQVIDAITDYYRTSNSNVHRGAHTLSDRATTLFEGARKTVTDFINAQYHEEVIWTKGTTESINLVAFSWGLENLKPGDRVLVSEMEHHDRVRFVSVAHVSNALGTVNSVETIIELAHRVGALVMIDGAQAVAHWPLDVQKLGCDFYAFSGHKLYGPTGIGVLWGKKALLDSMTPFMGGGEMIEVVTFAKTTYNKLPFKFEPGTPNIAGAVGLSAALQYLNGFDRSEIVQHESAVLEYAIERARSYDGLTLIGQAEHRAGVMSFVIDGAHSSDVGTLLDQQGVAVRTGNHCAMPIMQHYGITGTVRASFAMYNSKEDVDALFMALDKVKFFLM